MRPGTRVRKARGDSNLGVTGTVSADPVVESRRHQGYDMTVLLDREVPGVPAGRVAATCACNWEPIVPEGHQPVEWSECLWQPQGEHA